MTRITAADTFYFLCFVLFDISKVLIDALILGMPNILRFTVGAIPVYIGFALFGFAAFSEATLRVSLFYFSVVWYPCC
jgi:hypothetical protein